MLGFRIVAEPDGWIFVAKDGCMIMLGECPDFAGGYGQR
jgi:hypothetical protein